MSYKVLNQTDKFFQIKHPDGSTFTVPKKGLSEAMLEKIRTMDGYAKGGAIDMPPEMYATKGELAAMTPEQRNERSMRLMQEAQAARTPMDMRFAAGVKPYPGQPEVQGKLPPVEDTISPIDFISPGMVTAPAKAIGKGLAAVGREALEAAPRILSNEMGAIGADIKSSMGHFDRIKELEKQIAELMSQKQVLMKEARAMAPEAKPSGEMVPVAERELPPVAQLRKGREAQTEIMGVSGEPKPGSEAYKQQAKAFNQYTTRKFNAPIVEAGGKFMTLEEINAERIAEGLPRLTKKQIKASKDYEVSPSTTTERGETFYRSKTQKAGAKPDWRSGQLESQQGIQAMVHEPAHIIVGPKNMKMGDFQEWMDEGSRRAGALKTASGESRQGAAKQIQEEIQPMALENPLRRRAGLPVLGRPQYTDPGYGARMTPIKFIETPEGVMVQPELVQTGKKAGEIRKITPPLTEYSQPRIALDTGTEYATRLRDPNTGEIFDYIAQSKNLSPENMQRLRDFDENVIRFHPERGLVESNSPEALINLRGQGRFEEAKRRLKTRGADRFAHGGKVGEGKNMSYRIIKDAEDHYQVLHPDGSKFTVPKKGISKAMLEKISAMPKLFDGGRTDLATGDQDFGGMDESIPVNIGRSNIPDSLESEMIAPSYSSIPVNLSPTPALSPEETNQRLAAMNRQELQQTAPRYMPASTPFDLSALPEGESSMPSQAVAEQPKTKQPATPQAQATVVTPEAVMPTGMDLYGKQFAQMQGRVDAFNQRIKTEEALAKAEMDKQLLEADQRQKEMNDYIVQADDEAQKLFEQNKIDPGKYWSNMSTGNKIMAGLSVALGGIGQGLMGPGAKNYALDIINKAIDSDIDAQKENRNSAYNMLLNKHKRHETALAAAKADALQKVQNQINQFAMTTKSIEVQQAAAKLSNDLELQKITLQDSYKKKAAGEYLTNQAAKGATLSPEEIQLLPEDTRKRFINGAGLASGDQAATKIREIKANADDITAIVNRLRQIRTQVGRELTPSDASTVAQSLGAVLIGKLKDAVTGPGTMSESDAKRIEMVAPKDVTELASLNANMFAKLDTLQEIINNNLDNKLKVEGIRPKARPQKTDGFMAPQQGLMLNK